MITLTHMYTVYYMEPPYKNNGKLPLSSNFKEVYKISSTSDRS